MDFKDPALQTGPFPAWPTLSQMPQPTPRYLENDPTAWQGGDFPTRVSPWAIIMSLLGARSVRGAQTMRPKEGFITPPNALGLQEEASGQAIYAPSINELAARGLQSAKNPIPLQTTENIRPPSNLNWNYPSSLSPIEEKILEYLRSKPDQSANHAELFRHLGILTTPKVVKPEDEGDK